MPTVFRFDGLRVVIYLNDHRPEHVHVSRSDGEAVFILNCPDGPPELRESYGFNRSTLGRMERRISDDLHICAQKGADIMTIAESELERAEERMRAVRNAGYAVSVRYDPDTSRVVVDLITGVQIAVPVEKIEGLAGASPDDLAEVEISPAGLGLHWPRLDADVYVPALLEGVFGSRRWMAAQLGAEGGKARSVAKAAAARENGRKGGRPRNVAAR